MYFYKIISANGQFIGIGTSYDLRQFQLKHKVLLRCGEKYAQYIECNSKLYHDSWMRSLNSNIPYEISNVLRINEEEYSLLQQSIEVGEAPLEIEEYPSFAAEDKEPEPSTLTFDENATLEYIKQQKTKFLSNKCKNAIISGIDTTFPNNICEHFDLTVEDQLNLNTLRYKLNQGEEYFIYHSKGGSFTYYSKEEIQLIIETADKHILYHNAYFNSLKQYVNSLNDYIQVSKIEYGQEIPTLYKSEILKSLEK